MWIIALFVFLILLIVVSPFYFLYSLFKFLLKKIVLLGLNKKQKIYLKVLQRTHRSSYNMEDFTRIVKMCPSLLPTVLKQEARYKYRYERIVEKCKQSSISDWKINLFSQLNCL